MESAATPPVAMTSTASGASRATPDLDFGGFASPVRGVGPGSRVIAWVRGCPRECVGCFAPDLRGAGNDLAKVEDVAAVLMPHLREADGLTLSGGEPFLQPAGLRRLVERLREELPDLEVVVYTGYTREEVEHLGADARDFLAVIDILIDGPYLESAGESLRWRGSDNQRVLLLSDRSQRYADEASSPWEEPRHMSVQLVAPDRFRVIGIPRRGDVEKFVDAMRIAGVEVRKAT